MGRPYKLQFWGAERGFKLGVDLVQRCSWAQSVQQREYVVLNLIFAVQGPISHGIRMVNSYLANEAYIAYSCHQPIPHLQQYLPPVRACRQDRKRSHYLLCT